MLRRKHLVTLGHRPEFAGDEQYQLFYEKCLVVGACKRRLCPPTHRCSDSLPANRPLVDLRLLLRPLSVSRLALAALTSHVTYASALEAARFSFGGPISGGVARRAPVTRRAPGLSLSSIPIGRARGLQAPNGALSAPQVWQPWSATAPGSARLFSISSPWLLTLVRLGAAVVRG